MIQEKLLGPHQASHAMPAQPQLLVDPCGSFLFSHMLFLHCMLPFGLLVVGWCISSEEAAANYSNIILQMCVPAACLK